uniref:Uncharacterized protein n=1 Tax=Sphaerodactylus townsendi TaxID=933632 RepID=A0ACB8EI80_9SAUR
MHGMEPLCNASTNWSCQATPRVPYSPLSTALILLAVLTVALVTLMGNVLVVLAVYTSRALRAPQNLFLVSLAAADILVATLIIPFSLVNELMGYWCFGPLWCSLYLSLDVLFCTASIMHLCAISLDRYWAVTRAARYNLKRSPRRVKCTIGVVWAIAAFVSLPPLFKSTSQAWKCQLHDDTWYVLASCTASFYAPCLIMVAVYCRIYHVAKHRNSIVLAARRASHPTLITAVKCATFQANTQQPPGEVQSPDLEQGQLSLNLPSLPRPSRQWWAEEASNSGARPQKTQRLSCLESVFGEDCCISRTLFKFFFWIGYCNSSLNPIIYTVFNRDFRRAFQHLLSRACQLSCRK